MMTAAVFAAAFAVLYAAHQVADHWVQTNHQAQHKALPGWVGRKACAAHVATYTATCATALLALTLATDVRLPAVNVAVALGVNAVSHYVADRRTPLQRLAELIPGKAAFWALGTPRPGHDDNASLGTGAYALDQSWHVGWLAVAALLIA